MDQENKEVISVIARTIRGDVVHRAASMLLDSIMHVGLQHGRVDMLDWRGRRRSYVGRKGADGPSVKLTVSDPNVVR